MKSPLLAICTASLEWLNDRLIDPTFLEKLESWKKNKIGNAIFGETTFGIYIKLLLIEIDSITSSDSVHIFKYFLIKFHM